MSDEPIQYPDDFDGDHNLFHVADSIRATLHKDYVPGDREIHIDADAVVLSRWPNSGLITLTDQCDAIDKRAISFSFDGFDRDNGVILNVKLIPGFPDVKKFKGITNVTQNVMAAHHNHLKDAVMAIQKFAGVEGEVDSAPFGPTMEGRVNFLRRLALAPRAWFTADKQIGIVPLEVEFTDMSFRLETNGETTPVTVTWDFGDNTTSVISNISIISATDVAPGDDNVYILDLDGGKIKKTYMRPGIYDVTLKVENKFGSDTCTFPQYINPRIPAPDEAVIKIVPGDGQEVTPGIPSDGPYAVAPRIRSPINTLIEFEIPAGVNPSTNKSYAGEHLNQVTHSPLDPVASYTWHLGDDLNHVNNRTTKASYGIGGIYDLKLRVDTKYGAYRITTYPACIDIVENLNLWMWVFSDPTTVRTYEYGLLSGSFKLNSNSTTAINRDSSFLNGVPDSQKQKREFFRNVGFAPRTTISSGQNGSAAIFYASGRSPMQSAAEELIRFTEYAGFSDSYITRPAVSRPWNWASFSSVNTAFFSFGATNSIIGPNNSPTNTSKTSTDLMSFVSSESEIAIQDLVNGAQDLLQNPATYDSSGNSQYGHYSVYRTAWKDSTGYIARNDAVGPFFRIKSFYRTEGSVSSPFQIIRKLNDIQGPTKLEGQLSNLSQGIYFFNNSGSISAFDDNSSVWRTGGPGVSSMAYRAVQDTSVDGFDAAGHTLLAASDGDHNAYISFDYSDRVFIKFNELELTYSTLGARPAGEQFLTGIY